eukprot:scaffold207096_cov36-Tisochrysis_lutea.AAC.2
MSIAPTVLFNETCRQRGAGRRLPLTEDPIAAAIGSKQTKARLPCLICGQRRLIRSRARTVMASHACSCYGGATRMRGQAGAPGRLAQHAQEQQVTEGEYMTHHP